MRVVSVNVGRPRLIAHEGRSTSTAIFKHPVEGPILLDVEGFDGDHQANRRVHGGPEMAVCVYPHEHYGDIAGKLGAELSPGAFGENLTTSGLLEDEACIGDVMRIGAAVVQISKPREPCVNLALRHGNPGIVRWIAASLHTGFYLRVVEPGLVGMGDAIELLERHHAGLTVARTMHAMIAPRPDADTLTRLVACEGLSPGCATRFAKRLASTIR